MAAAAELSCVSPSPAENSPSNSQRMVDLADLFLSMTLTPTEPVIEAALRLKNDPATSEAFWPMVHMIAPFIERTKLLAFQCLEYWEDKYGPLTPLESIPDSASPMIAKTLVAARQVANLPFGPLSMGTPGTSLFRRAADRNYGLFTRTAFGRHCHLIIETLDTLMEAVPTTESYQLWLKIKIFRLQMQGIRELEPEKMIGSWESLPQAMRQFAGPLRERFQ